VLAEAVADVLTLVEWRHGEKIGLAVSRSGVDSPRDEADDRALGEGGHGCVTARLGRVECRKLVAVVLSPVAGSVLVHLLAEVGTGVAFEERSEGLGEKVGGRGMVVDLKWPDAHRNGLSFERTGTARATVAPGLGSPMASALSAGARGGVAMHDGDRRESLHGLATGSLTVTAAGL
jgi:hypothetical protein